MAPIALAPLGTGPRHQRVLVRAMPVSLGGRASGICDRLHRLVSAFYTHPIVALPTVVHCGPCRDGGVALVALPPVGTGVGHQRVLIGAMPVSLGGRGLRVGCSLR